MVTYDFLQDVDLVEEHALLVLVHMALSEYLYGSLGRRFPVDTHSDLTECTCNKRILNH